MEPRAHEHNCVCETNRERCATQHGGDARPNPSSQRRCVLKRRDTLSAIPGSCTFAAFFRYRSTWSASAPSTFSGHPPSMCRMPTFLYAVRSVFTCNPKRRRPINAPSGSDAPRCRQKIIKLVSCGHTNRSNGANGRTRVSTHLMLAGPHFCTNVRHSRVPGYENAESGGLVIIIIIFLPSFSKK